MCKSAGWGKGCCLRTSAPEMDVHNPIISTVHTRFECGLYERERKKSERALGAEKSKCWPGLRLSKAANGNRRE
jgi:hypothetical protein